MSAAYAPRTRPPARRTWLWVFGFLFCAAGLVITHEFFISSTRGQWLEHATLESRYASITQGPMQNDILRRMLSTIPLATAIIAAVIFLANMFIRQRFIAAGIALATFLGANITTQLLKEFWVHRADPQMPMSDPNMELWWWSVNSFPSGHATMAAGAAVSVFLICGPRQRPFVGIMTALLAMLSGVAIFLTGHFASDIIAAYLVVACWGLIGGWLIMRSGERWNSISVEAPMTTAAGAGLAWLLGIVFTALTVGVFIWAGGWSAVVNAATDPSPWHWVAGALLPVGPGFILCGMGISFFSAETGRHRPGEPVRPLPTQHPIPPQFAHLYEV